MIKLVVMTEEESMVPVIRELVCKINADIACTIIPHQGASDLERSIPRKLRAWREPDARFLIVRDNDNAICADRKKRLEDLVRQSGTRAPFKIRLVCQALEAWFIGDPEALVASQLVKATPVSAKFRGDPDAIQEPLRVLEQVCGPYAKVSNAKKVARHLDPSRNRSASFQAMVDAIRGLTI